VSIALRTSLVVNPPSVLVVFEQISRSRLARPASYTRLHLGAFAKLDFGLVGAA